MYDIVMEKEYQIPDASPTELCFVTRKLKRRVKCLYLSVNAVILGCLDGGNGGWEEEMGKNRTKLRRGEK